MFFIKSLNLCTQHFVSSWSAQLTGGASTGQAAIGFRHLYLIGEFVDFVLVVFVKLGSGEANLFRLVAALSSLGLAG